MSMSFWDTWEGPEDELKRPSPYVEDFRATIETHIASPPFGHSSYSFDNEPREQVSRFTLMDSLITQGNRHCGARGHVTPCHWGSPGAQVISVSVTPSGEQKSFLAVAKIFDAMYYPFRNQEWGHAQDVVYFADADYSREASAMAFAEEIGQAGHSAP